MRSYKEYLVKPLLENEEISGLDKFKALLGDKIDNLVYQLKRELISGAGANSNRASLWDKVKNWGSNLLWGKKSPANPYRWVNQFGHLGTQNSLGSPSVQNPEQNPQVPTENTLEIYKLVKESVEKLEAELFQIDEAVFSPNPSLSGNKKTTVLFSIIDQWGNKLKSDILDTVTRNINLMQTAPTTAEHPAQATQPEAPPEAKTEPETANQVFDRVVGSVLDKHNTAHAAPAAAVQDEPVTQPEQKPSTPTDNWGTSLNNHYLGKDSIYTPSEPAKEPAKEEVPAEEMPIDNLTLIDKIKKELHDSSLDDSLKKDIDEEFQNIISGKKKKLKNQKLKELLAHIQYYKANSQQLKSNDPDVDDLMNSPDQIDWDSLTNN